MESRAVAASQTRRQAASEKECCEKCESDKTHVLTLVKQCERSKRNPVTVEIWEQTRKGKVELIEY